MTKNLTEEEKKRERMMSKREKQKVQLQKREDLSLLFGVPSKKKK